MSLLLLPRENATHERAKDQGGAPIAERCGNLEGKTRGLGVVELDIALAGLSSGPDAKIRFGVPTLQELQQQGLARWTRPSRSTTPPCTTR